MAAVAVRGGGNAQAAATAVCWNSRISAGGLSRGSLRSPRFTGGITCDFVLRLPGVFVARPPCLGRLWSAQCANSAMLGKEIIGNANRKNNCAQLKCPYPSLPSGILRQALAQWENTHCRSVPRGTGGSSDSTTPTPCPKPVLIAGAENG